MVGRAPNVNPKVVSQSSTLANAKQHAKEKEMAASVTNVYLHVVEDVIHNVRTDFQSEGVEDNVLNELQAVRKYSLPPCATLPSVYFSS